MELWLKVQVSDSDLNDIRSVFDVPNEIEDIALTAHLVLDLIERYFDVSRWGNKDMEKIIDGIGGT